MKPLERQEGGDHYDLPIQPLEYIHANQLGYIEGNIIKYATRHKKKNGVEDIKKIIHYCELLLELEYGENKKEGTRKARHGTDKQPPEKDMMAVMKRAIA